MHEHRAHRGAALGIAVGGVLAGHWLTYRLLSPHAHVRDRLLADTGHGYLQVANDLGLAVVIGALAAMVLGRMIRRPAQPSAGHWFARLAAVGAGAFTLMEVVERLSSGAPLADLLRHGLLPAGIVIQVLVAAVSALAIRWLLRAVDRIQGALAAVATLPRPLFVGVAAVGWHPPLRLVTAADGIRGPPAVR